MKGNLHEYMVRLPPEAIEKIKELKSLGFSSSVILRQAVVEAVEQKLKIAKQMEKVSRK